MIKTKLKHHFIQRRIDKLFTYQAKNRIASNKKINSVAIITDESFLPDLDIQNIVIEKLQLRNPKIFTYRKFEKTHEKSFKHFSDEDFNWKGDMIDASLSSFINESWDLLICFYPEKNAYLEYMTLQSKASFKAGFVDVNSKLFDLEVAVNTNDVEGFFNEMKKYLTILKKL